MSKNLSSGCFRRVVVGGRRLLGASLARAPTLTFLDAHCECARGWLEPLLAQVARDRSAVPCPTIGNVRGDAFDFLPGVEGMVGVFGRNFDFSWCVVVHAQPMPVRRRQRKLGCSKRGLFFFSFTAILRPALALEEPIAKFTL